MLVAAIVTLPLLIAAPPDASIGLDALGSLIALGVGGTGLAFILFYTLIADVGPRRAAIVSYVAPAFSIAYGVVLLGESLGPGAIAGLVLILAGSWLGAEGRLPGRPRVSRSGPSRSSAPAPARVP
jgi:drug/metabolite transporter (DMT)-like permease